MKGYDEEYEIFKDCLKKRKKAQRALFNKYLTSLLAVSERYCSFDDAQDIVQESFVTIFNKIDTYEWQGEKSFLSWMKKIVANASINFYQKNKKYTNIPIEDEDIEYEAKGASINFHEQEKLQPNHLLQNGFKTEDYINCINSINEPYKTAFNMHVLDDYTHKEIASLLNISVKTSTTRVYRARVQLQAEILQLLKEREVKYGE